MLLYYVGTKRDLINSDIIQHITDSLHDKNIINKNRLCFISAKTGIFIEELFEKIFDELIDNNIMTNDAINCINDKNIIQLNNDNIKKNYYCC